MNLENIFYNFRSKHNVTHTTGNLFIDTANWLLIQRNFNILIARRMVASWKRNRCPDVFLYNTFKCYFTEGHQILSTSSSSSSLISSPNSMSSSKPSSTKVPVSLIRTVSGNSPYVFRLRASSDVYFRMTSAFAS